MMVLAIQREKRRYIHNTTQIDSIIREMRIQSNSMEIFFFFSFSPFYLLLSQRRTFFNILPFETTRIWRRKGEKEEKEEEEGGRDGSSTKKKDKTSLFVFLV